LAIGKPVSIAGWWRRESKNQHILSLGRVYNHHISCILFCKIIYLYIMQYIVYKIRVYACVVLKISLVFELRVVPIGLNNRGYIVF